MRVRINNGFNTYYREGDFVEPLHGCAEVIVVVDPGKTNMAVQIGSPWGERYALLEFSGSDDVVKSYTGGRVENTTEYCSQFKEYLRLYLRECDVVFTAIEQAVGYKGMQYFTSQLVLTELRSNLLAFSKEEYGIIPKEINNWAWKNAVLPQQYHTQKDKGSYLYLAPQGFANYTNDATDVICMYVYCVTKYTKDVFKIRYTKLISKYYDGGVSIVPIDFPLTPEIEIEYDYFADLKEHADSIANKTDKQVYMLVPLDRITEDEIVKYSVCFDEPYDKQKVKVLLCRLSETP